MTAPRRPARRARPRGASGARRWPARLAAVVLLALVIPVAGGSAAGAAIRGGLVERIARPDSSTGSPRSSTASSTDESGGSLPSSPGSASSSTGPGNRVTVTVDEVQAPAAGSSVVSVQGTLSTSGPQPLTDLRMSLSIGSPAVTSRGRLETLAENGEARPQPSYRQLPLSGGQSTQPLSDPPVQGADPVRFMITSDLGASALPVRVGVYPLRVKVTGSVGGQPVAPLGVAYTFLVRSSGQQQRTPVAVVLPLADQPRLRSDGLLTDNELADEVKPTGRLYRLLDAARSTVTAEGRPAVTLAVDPTLVQALQIMTNPDGYHYASPGGGADGVKEPQSSDAAQFLNDIKNFADAGGGVFALPYGDADLAALVHAQKLDTVSYAVNTGQVVLAALLKREPAQMASVAYPVDGLADTATVDVLRQLKVGTVLLDDRILRPGSAVPYTPSATYELPTSAGPIRALATDHRLAEIATSFDGRADGPSAGVVLTHFRADLAMITAEQSEPRFQVLALPRGWNPPTDDWAKQVLGAIDSDYSVPVPLDGGAGQNQSPARRGVLVYPADAQARELPVTYLDAVASVRDEALALGPVLCPPPKATRTCRIDRVDPMSNALVTATSVAWRGGAWSTVCR
ncbi:DUF6049 family protein [Frankia sp. ArI3]|uniref:DUF6049 family protein n=1 Tax=Frankia sp. ArI3 TaxID=1858 RepID=UPI00351D8648